MKTYKISIIILMVLGMIFGAISVGLHHNRYADSGVKERQNQIHTDEQRVFDNADVLSDEEEEKLEKLIWQKQEEVHLDIVLVTIDDFSYQSEDGIESFAVSFYNDNDFGWNQPKGDGVIFADNWAEGGDGKYCHFVTKGIAMDRISQSESDEIVERVCEKVNVNPYEAYKRYVNWTVSSMKSEGGLNPVIPLAVAVIFTIIFIIYQLMYNKGKDTTSKSTYIDKDGIHTLKQQDVFLHSHVSRVRIKHEDHSSNSGGSSHGGSGGRH